MCDPSVRRCNRTAVRVRFGPHVGRPDAPPGQVATSTARQEPANYIALGEASLNAISQCASASIAYAPRRRLGYENPDLRDPLGGSRHTERLPSYLVRCVLIVLITPCRRRRRRPGARRRRSPRTCVGSAGLRAHKCWPGNPASDLSLVHERGIAGR